MFTIVMSGSRVLAMRSIRPEKQKHDENLKAFVWLLSHFVKLRTKHLRKAFALWRDWEAKDTRGKLRGLLNSEPKPARPRRQSKEESVAEVAKIV